MSIFSSILFTSLAVGKTFPTEEFWLTGTKKYWKTFEKETDKHYYYINQQTPHNTVRNATDD